MALTEQRKRQLQNQLAMWRSEREQLLDQAKRFREEGGAYRIQAAESLEALADLLESKINVTTRRYPELGD